ncbi:hypothetical protein C7M84_011149 [Penaeus vannamei]|uniref:Uncharacterized protein n=1 Tax=Penaeus vannamei TaxID=6689 RepID=A0A423T1X5_PENVA|nr:hypothetical protein C7M84_011149 [Penaeus vannamei]
MSCDHLGVMHAGAYLEHRGILSSLVSANRPVIGPLLFHRRTKESNLVYSEDSSAEWQKLIRRQKVRGVFMVEEVRYFNLIQKDYIRAFAEGEQIGRYVDTRVDAGTIVDPRGHKEGKRNPDLWGIKHNNYMWTRRQAARLAGIEDQRGVLLATGRTHSRHRSSSRTPVSSVHRAAMHGKRMGRT